MSRHRRGKATARKRWQWRCKMRTLLLIRDGNRCCICDCLLVLGTGQERSISIDHKVPRCRGGSDHPSNLQLTCAQCNHAKGAGMSEQEG